MNDLNSLSTSDGTDNNKKVATASEIASMYSENIVFKRWMATIIDFIILSIMVAAAFIVFTMPDSNFFIKFAKALCLMYVILIIAYYLVIEAITGYTLGKLLLRIRVVDNNFNPPGFLKSLVRTVLRLVEVNPILLGGIPAGIITLTSKNKQRLGDMAAGTYVFEVCDIREDKRVLGLSKAKKASVFVVISLISFTLLSGAICLIIKLY